MAVRVGGRERGLKRSVKGWGACVLCGHPCQRGGEGGSARAAGVDEAGRK